ncbi:hypothetical protein JW872_01625 [Candidatus Babeliales bacterium]|nr:hypothetical protein [Candidatus Babeliales bacterium]
MLNFIPRVTKDIVGVNITPRTITLSWIAPSKQGPAPYDIKALKQLLIETRPEATLRIFNPTRLDTLITTFLEKHNLKNACIIFALSGKGVIEKQAMMKKPVADLEAFEQKLFNEPGFADTHSNQMVWNYYCLQDTKEHHEAPWYFCGMSQELLFQYQLLAIRCKLNLIHITTSTMALLQAHLHLKELRKGNPEAQKITILGNLNMNGHKRTTTQHDHAALAEGFGLYLLGKQTYEMH